MQTFTGKFPYLIAPLALALFLYAVGAAAQDEPPAPQTSDRDTVESLPDQEVEVNEDNYRQFMELKDGLRERTVLPEESFESRAGMQKLDKLPEASQKHLRNQLREIIVQGDRWQPGDENINRPYVPSEAARTNASLQQQEAEAWGELLDNYHAREAQIHAHSARSRAASAGPGGMPPGQGGESGGKGEEGAQRGQEGSKTDSVSTGEADSYAPGSQGSSDAQSTDGVAQSAMEFLQGAGYQAGSEEGFSGESDEGGDSGQDGGRQQLAGQPGGGSREAQDEAATTREQNNVNEQASQGVAQNAMEYLQQSGQPESSSSDVSIQQASDSGDTGQENAQVQTDIQQDVEQLVAQSPTVHLVSDQSTEARTEGVSQNALEYLTGEDQPAQQETADTLSIEDLFRARGVTTGTDTVDVPKDPDVPPRKLPDKSDKGGG